MGGTRTRGYRLQKTRFAATLLGSPLVSVGCSLRGTRILSRLPRNTFTAISGRPVKSVSKVVLVSVFTSHHPSFGMVMGNMLAGVKTVKSGFISIGPSSGGRKTGLGGVGKIHVSLRRLGRKRPVNFFPTKKVSVCGGGAGGVRSLP